MKGVLRPSRVDGRRSNRIRPEVIAGSLKRATAIGHSVQQSRRRFAEWAAKDLAELRAKAREIVEG